MTTSEGTNVPDQPTTPHLVYVDVETTGLDPERHCIWEMAYAIDDQPVQQSIVWHDLTNAVPAALKIGQYDERARRWRPEVGMGDHFELIFRDTLKGATLVAANPAFDANMLAARWGVAPWHYRLLDIEAFAMGALEFDRPRGLNTIARTLRDRFGFDIPDPDHTAGGDVTCLRACHLALIAIYDAPSRWMQGWPA